MLNCYTEDAECANLPGSQNLQRVRGRAHLALANRRDKTTLDDLHQSGCLKILLPKTRSAIPQAVLVNTAGGITGGDRLDYSLKLLPDCRLSTTTQAAERIYKSTSGQAQISTTIDLDENCKIDWLPQETILFDRSRLSRRLTVNMPASASATLLETIILGRQAMGEVIKECEFSDRWHIRRNGRLIYADTLCFDKPQILGGSSTFGSVKAVATLLHVSKNADFYLQEMRSLIMFKGIRTAASAWNGMMIVRFASDDPMRLRKALCHLLENFSQTSLPRIWKF